MRVSLPVAPWEIRGQRRKACHRDSETPQTDLTGAPAFAGGTRASMSAAGAGEGEEGKSERGRIVAQLA